MKIVRKVSGRILACFPLYFLIKGLDKIFSRRTTVRPRTKKSWPSGLSFSNTRRYVRVTGPLRRKARNRFLRTYCSVRQRTGSYWVSSRERERERDWSYDFLSTFPSCAHRFDQPLHSYRLFRSLDCTILYWENHFH